MPEVEFTRQDQKELEDLQDVFTFKPFGIIKKLIAQRARELKLDSEKYLAQHEDRKAGEFLKASKEVGGILEYIDEKRKDLSDRETEHQNQIGV